MPLNHQLHLNLGRFGKVGRQALMGNSESQPTLLKVIKNIIAGSKDTHFDRLRELPCTVASLKPLNGGCISNAFLLTLKDGKQVFVKSCIHDIALYKAERNGLEAIRATQTLRVPEVLGLGKTDCGSSFLVLEAVESGHATATSEIELGRCLAKMHRKTQVTRFGYPQSNFIGSTTQVNNWTDDWTSFFIEHRLTPQIKLAQNHGLTTPTFNRSADHLLSKLGKLLTNSFSPVLIHGDLWAGNVIIAKEGTPVLIDPAVSYSDREFEFGMTTLFGEFGSHFYEAYNEFWPLNDGWQERVKIYQLYHLLNHLNLFGSSYFEACMTTLKRFS